MLEENGGSLPFEELLRECGKLIPPERAMRAYQHQLANTRRRYRPMYPRDEFTSLERKLEVGRRDLFRDNIASARTMRNLFTYTRGDGVQMVRLPTAEEAAAKTARLKKSRSEDNRRGWRTRREREARGIRHD